MERIQLLQSSFATKTRQFNCNPLNTNMDKMDQHTEKNFRRVCLTTLLGWHLKGQPLRPQRVLVYLKNFRRMKGCAKHRTAYWFWARDLWIGNPALLPQGHCSLIMDIMENQAISFAKKLKQQVLPVIKKNRNSLVLKLF